MDIWLTEISADRHLAKRVLFGRHKTYRFLAGRYFANRHWVDTHLANRNLAIRHLAIRHLAISFDQNLIGRQISFQTFCVDQMFVGKMTFDQKTQNLPFKCGVVLLEVLLDLGIIL